jgi:hypothetical protein
VLLDALSCRERFHVYGHDLGQFLIARGEHCFGLDVMSAEEVNHASLHATCVFRMGATSRTRGVFPTKP